VSMVDVMKRNQRCLSLNALSSSRTIRVLVCVFHPLNRVVYLK
jgi:hypothetical protein